MFRWGRRSIFWSIGAIPCIAAFRFGSKAPIPISDRSVMRGAARCIRLLRRPCPTPAGRCSPLGAPPARRRVVLKDLGREVAELLHLTDVGIQLLPRVLGLQLHGLAEIL